MTIDKNFIPHELEKKWYQTWENAGYFKPIDKPSQPSYCIMLPPPNVTGTLHMGHAFQDTIMDALIRYHRMKGHQTLWQGGTDHAGIATQMVVERQLQAQGTNKHQIGREQFVAKVWEWKAESGNTISTQMRRLGASIDWTRERFTMDEGLSDAVREVFVRLYDEGLIYRGKRLVNWDPKLHTAISDLEVITEEEDGKLWYIRYPVQDKSTFLIVATTRPETMLGDVAVAVHPEDNRYQHLIGEMVRLPLCDRLIPIIADEFVDPEFGTGCVKITPAHDFNDNAVGKKHGLPMINIFTPDANINANAPHLYQGLSRFVAREKIVEHLKAASLLEKIEPHRLKIPRGDRSGEIVEPYLTDQWFVNVKPLAEKALEVVQTGQIEFVPENWTKIYYEWMNNIQDWCISRQLWWGHRIPAWYDHEGNVYVGHTLEEVRTKYNLGDDFHLTQDDDVLDTWFSSALWPFSTLGWPELTPELDKYYPTNVLVTGFDIIFFWVARMIMMGLKFTGKVPFSKVFVHGLIQDAEGQKMSKSKGNILDPIDLIDGITLDELIKKRTFGLMQPEMAKQIEKDTRKHFPQGIPSFGTDALRFTFCALATTNRHIRFDLARIEGYRNFCNKIWNASRYAFMNLEGQSLGTKENREFTLFDKWIWSTWQQTKKTVEEHIALYRFDIVAQTLYDFTWNQFCDWYLELSKPVLTQPQFSANQQFGVRFTLAAILEELLRALHPFMPFITEEIWQKIKPVLGESYFSTPTDSIMLQPYPVYDQNKQDKAAEQALKWIQDIIMSVRNVRGEMDINPSKLLKVCYRTNNEDISATITANQQTIQTLGKLSELFRIDDKQTPTNSANMLVGELEIFVSLEGLIDYEAEIKRLDKEMEKQKKDIDFYEKKFANLGYLNKAPAEVVEKERERLKLAKLSYEKLQENRNKMLEFVQNK